MKGHGRIARPVSVMVRDSALVLVAVALAFSSRLPLRAQHEGVAGTVHNLSVSGPGEIRALGETEVCKFCHVPHSAVVAEPLWGHALSSGLYDVPRLRAGSRLEAPAPQPDGSSRLCLSCHDGTVALGEIAGEPRPVTMAGAQRLTPGRPGYLGTDLSGSHPISFVITELDSEASDSDMGLRPLAALSSDPDVRLDTAGKMQCTTCHDPHADRFHVPDRVPRFWVKPTVDQVCLVCHEVR